MKRLLVPIVALLAFSVLLTSVSAPVTEYYAARYYGRARGCCLVFEEEPGPGVRPTAFGEGRLRIRGFAVTVRGPAYYVAQRSLDPNTWVWTHFISYMGVSWDSEKLWVHLWASSKTAAGFNDTTNTFIIRNLTFSGGYRGGALQVEIRGTLRARKFIWGTAHVAFERIGDPGEEFLAGLVVLYIGTEHFRSFMWLGEEVPDLPPDGCLAQWFGSRVTVQRIG